MRVLLPVDPDENRAVAAAEAVTAIPNADETVHVTVLSVQRQFEASDAARVTSERWFDEDEYPTSVDSAMKVLTDAGITAEKRREHADPAETVVEIADEIGADRIIMTGRKRTPVGKVLFGSVTQSVLLTANTPVTFVGERDE